MLKRYLLMAALCCALAPAARALSPTAEPQAAVVAGNKTALDLYAQLAPGRDNLFFSPVSISLALAMTFTGARGETAAEMARALNLSADQAGDLEALADAYGGFLDQLAPRHADTILDVVNRLWGQSGSGFHREFLARLDNHFSADLQELDFQQGTEGPRRLINDWVAEQTRGKIRDLISPGLLTPDTRLVLTNAIYFRGDWVQEFKKHHTRDRPFRRVGETEINVPTMAQLNSFQHGEIEGGQLLSLPFKGEDLDLVILLPNAVDGLADLEAKLDFRRLDGWLKTLAPALVDVRLPRFRLEDAFSLGKVMQKLGMRKAFGTQADFSGMAPSNSLFIFDIVHKSYVDVFEKGLEAAAVTAITMGETMMPLRPMPRVIFHADHPFLFLIRHRPTGSILFMGRVTDPS